MVSDYGAVGYASQKGNPDILKQRAVEALTAGNDIELPSNNCYKYLPELIEDSLVNEKYFEIAVKRALMLKSTFGGIIYRPEALCNRKFGFGLSRIS